MRFRGPYSGPIVWESNTPTTMAPPGPKNIYSYILDFIFNSSLFYFLISVVFCFYVFKIDLHVWDYYYLLVSYMVEFCLSCLCYRYYDQIAGYLHMKWFCYLMIKANTSLYTKRKAQSKISRTKFLVAKSETRD